jgi:hypothetical protein
MSTLTSVDMNIERSTTRLHAPPGGKTTFSIGGGWSEDEAPKRTGRKEAPSTLMDLKMQRDANETENMAKPAPVVAKVNSTKPLDGQQQAFKPSTRVKHAPGGASSLQLF